MTQDYYHSPSWMAIMRSRRTSKGGRKSLNDEIDERIAKVKRKEGRCRAPRRKTPAELTRVARRTAQLRQFWHWLRTATCPCCGRLIKDHLPGEPRK